MNYDVFFISFNESNQEINWQRVQELHPNAVRLHGIRGIDRVHLLCNELASTERFWTVDGDNWLLEKMYYKQSERDADLLLFHALDPVTKRWTKLGGVKLWKKDTIVNKDMSKGDFCLNAVETKHSPLKIFSRTDYNATRYEAWKTAFRHCVKLLSPILGDRPYAESAKQYLEGWKKCQSLDNGENNAQWCYRGYLDAEEFVADPNLDLSKINDYTWLKTTFESKYGK
jgi:hypothetical protein